MKIFKAKQESQFAQVPNETAQNSTLSFEARGLLTLILSLPEDWTIHKSWLLKQCPNTGRDKLNRMVNELQNSGYLVKRQTRTEGGQFASDEWLAYAVPVNGFTDDGLTVNGLAVNGKPATTNKQVNKEINKQTNNTTTKRFQKPSVEELISYMTEQGFNNPTDTANYFIDYYESKDWMIGKNRMKDWKAAVRTWKRKETPNQPDYSNIPINQIVDSYNQHVAPALGYHVDQISDKTKADIARQWNKSNKTASITWFAQFFAACRNHLNDIEQQYRPKRYRLESMFSFDFETIWNELG